MVRVGRTVRRPATASSSFVAELIGDLQREGCTGAPRHLQPSALPATVQAAQARVLADAYGLDATSRSRLIDAALDRQARNARWRHSHLAGPSPCVPDDHTIAGLVRWSEHKRRLHLGQPQDLLG
ncbi:hypothetical protein [Streptomyces syringium]|uniref:hypothetical protein n=1 Tax=Streptomyces syringium TaxID=76729 RepID=UPI003433D094